MHFKKHQRNTPAMQTTQFKTLTDPIGHKLIVNPRLYTADGCKDFEEVAQIILSPDFIITIKEEANYYFRLLEWEMNIVIEAKEINGYFVAEKSLLNPTSEYVSDLLKEGMLTTFNV
jgi:hypothetical protein